MSEPIWITDRVVPGVVEVRFKIDEVVIEGKTEYQHYLIGLNREWGDCLFLDGRLQSTAVDEFIYHEALVHLAMLIHPNSNRVLVLGGGEGSTVREVLGHKTVEQVTMVDLDGELVQICQEYLSPSFHRDSLKDPRTSFICADARQFLHNYNGETFDVIIMDLTEPLEEGDQVAMLYTKETFLTIQKCLDPLDGLFVTHAGSAGLLRNSAMPSIVKTMASVFPKVIPYRAFVPSFMDDWGFCIGTKPTFVSPDLLAKRMRERMFEPIRRFFLPWSGHSMCLLPPYLDIKLQMDGRIWTDDAPFDGT